MKPALLALVVLLASSCWFGDRPIPKAQALLHWSTVDLKPAAWCWNFGNRGECADSPGAEILLERGELKPVSTAGGFDARIDFKPADGLQDFEVDLVVGPGQPVHVTLSAERTFAIPMVDQSGAGVYAYAINSTWPEGSVTYFLALRLVPGVA